MFKPKVEIIFANLLAEKLWHLDTRKHATVFLGDDGASFLSVDDFLYTRCAVMANGRAFASSK